MIGVGVKMKGDKRVSRKLTRIPSKMKSAVRRGVNRTVKTAGTDVVRIAREKTGLRAGTIRKSTTIRRASGSNLSARVTVRGKRIPLIEFQARQTRRGVTYRIGHAARRRIDEGFIETMDSGHKGVFRRLGQARLPITELKGPSIPRVIKSERKPLMHKARTNLKKNITHEVNRVTKGS